MKLLDIVLILAILVIVFFAVRSVIRARKNGGGCGGCTGDCASCGMPQANRKKQ